MQRTGFEGYPVVEAGKVVGLLTRRAVDRAMAHKLNLTAASLMEAGEVAVHPDDSLQYLQARMTDSGWGQIPVADEDEKVIGIVTRTDLLTTLAPPTMHDGVKNLAARLEETLPPPQLELIRRVAAQAAEQHLAVYIVGGFVRDLLLEFPSLDYDIVVEGDAIALGKALGKKFGGRVTSHTRFGTAKWFLPETPDLELETLDLISARTEFYEHPTALPTVERGSIKLDLHRRDFTINTLALRLDGHHYGELHDYWGGLADIERGLVRVLHSLSFVDDPTRLLRAVRYEQRYGFEIESRTRQLMDAARSMLEKLTAERVRHELDRMLDEPNWVEMLKRLGALDLLKAIQPKRTLAWLLWLSPVDPPAIRRLSRRLRFPAALTKLLLAASTLRADLSSLRDAQPSDWVNRLEDVPEFAVYAVSFSVHGITEQSLKTYLQKWQHIKPVTTGYDLKELGLPPGPEYQNILRVLRSAWLDGEVKSPDEERVLLKQLLPKV
jgi:tRNA nucleotidyltransferase (CCA-adding enzyme)